MYQSAHSSDKPKLLYVEDELATAKIVAEMLGDTYDVTHAAAGEDGLQHALTTTYDVMVVDRRLPGMSGTELVTKLRRAHIATPVLMLTALGTIRNRVEGLDIGANDYLVKPFDFEELLARLRALRRGFRTSGVRRYLGDWTFLPDSSTLISPYETTVHLTEKENALLDLLSSNPERVFTRKEILSHVFPGKQSTGTVESYIHYIRTKAEPEIIATVRGRGYRAGDLA